MAALGRTSRVDSSPANGRNRRNLAVGACVGEGPESTLIRPSGGVRPSARLPSRPGELHPEPLTDPDLILSHHPARATARKLPPSAEPSGSSWHRQLAQLNGDDPPPSLHEHYTR